MKRKLKNRALKFITTASLLLAVTFSSINLEAKKDVRERSFMFIEGLRMLNLGNLTGAEKIFTELASKFPDMDAAYYYLADINLKTGNLTKASLLQRKQWKQTVQTTGMEFSLPEFTPPQATLTRQQKCTKGYLQEVVQTLH